MRREFKSGWKYFYDQFGFLIRRIGLVERLPAERAGGRRNINSLTNEIL